MISKTGLNKQEAAEKSHGVEVIQLDYETGEFIEEYPSLAKLAEDYNIPIGAMMSAVQRDTCCFIKMPKYQLLFIRKKHYQNMIIGEE